MALLMMLWLSAAISTGPTECDKSSIVSRPLVGAIRWDAWHGKSGQPGQVVEKTLGLAKYHHRLPFFAKITGLNQVEIRGDSQEVMDREIRHARKAKLDYWAFVTYEPDDPMSLGLKYYMSSKKKDGLRFCLITEQNKWGGKDNYRDKVSRFVRLMREPTYMKVLGNRPLMYIGFIDEAKTAKAWGTLAELKKAIDYWRAEVVKAGLGNPYLVVMAFDSGNARRQAEALGADAISSYALAGGSVDGAPFAESMKQAREFWDSYKATGLQVVPTVSFGWDPRPRIDTPVPWHKYRSGNYYQAARPDQLAQHLAEALDWTVTNRANARARTVLIYAWNENDEGGYLVPTLNPDGSANTERVEAIGQALENWVPTGLAK